MLISINVKNVNNMNKFNIDLDILLNFTFFIILG